MMRSDLAVRHNAAVGAIVGLAVGDMLAQCNAPPARVCGGQVELPAWGAHADRAFGLAEDLLRGQPIDMALSACDIVPTAVALADPDASPPLLTDPDAVLMCSMVRDALSGELDLGADRAQGVHLQIAIDAVMTADGFSDAMHAVLAHDPPAACLTGAISGMRFGPAAIPATWITDLQGPVGLQRPVGLQGSVGLQGAVGLQGSVGLQGAAGERTYRLRQLRRLAERLLQLDAPTPPEPRRSLGPREVAPKLWLSNLHAVPRFIADHPKGAVISLCPTTGAFDDHPIRREFLLHDASGRTVNPWLSAIVDEVLESIGAFHDEGREVLVHCHHGASRTGLILRAWLIRELDLAAEDATTEAQVRWPKTSTWNHAFVAEINRRAK